MKKFDYIIFFAILSGMVAIVILIYFNKVKVNEPNKKTTRASIGSRNNSISNDSVKLVAYNFAAEYVIESLQEPATAEFPNTKERLEHIKYMGEKKYQINSWVDSQDTYGAMTRRKFSCLIKLDISCVTKEKFLLEDYGPVR